jgi:hypothetical protein
MEGYAMSTGTTGEADVLRLRQNIQDLLHQRVLESVRVRNPDTVFAEPETASGWLRVSMEHSRRGSVQFSPRREPKG